MKSVFPTVLVGFGSVAVDIGNDKKMARFIKYQSHAQVLQDHERFDWCAVVDPNPEARAKASEEWGIPIVVPTIAELPVSFKPEIVVVATQPAIRLSVLESLPSLKGAIIEKPLGASYAEGVALKDHCEKRGLTVNVNLFRRADTTSQKMAAGGMAESVGEIQAGLILYGNGISNNGIHAIDQLQMLGAQVTAVKTLSAMRPSGLGKTTNDMEAVISLMLKNGAVVTMHPIDFKRYRDVFIDLWGTKGRLEIFQEGLFFRHSPLQEHRAIEGLMEIAIDNARVTPSQCGVAYYEMYSNLADSIDGEVEPLCSAADALASEAVLEAAYRSAQENGRIVEVSEIGE